MEAPNRVGLYKIRCMESDGEWEHVAITRKGLKFTVHDPHLGKVDLAYYHNGLTDLEWEFIA